MTANVNDLIFEKLDPVYGPGLGVSELLVAWWEAEESGSGFPVGDALYAAYGGDGAEHFADVQYAFWAAYEAP